MMASTSDMCKAHTPNGVLSARLKLIHLGTWHGLSMNVTCPMRAEGVMNNMVHSCGCECECVGMGCACEECDLCSYGGDE